ncbi:hypothetical protein F4782DRAFT_551681 [Xylaria castorea]|nr:hypothetical protein F4782DRAFT_551681 [Xylaria castorea]
MPPFTVTSTYAKGAVAMAAETFAAERPSGDPPGRKFAITLVAVIVSTVSAGVILFCTYLWVRSRRPSNHERLDDERNIGEEPIPLEDLRPPEDREIVPEPGNPSFNMSGPPSGHPRRRTVNEFTMALSSNPPSQTDLDTAEQTLNPETNIKKQDVDVPAIILNPPTPVPVPPTSPQPGPSQEQSHLHPTRRSNPRLEDSRRRGKVFEPNDDQGGFTGDGTLRVQSNLPPLPPAGPGIETMPNILDEYHQGQRQSMPNSEFFPPSTISEESTPDVTDTPGVESDVELAENTPESYLVTSDSQSPEADNNEAGIVVEHGDEPLPPSHEDEHISDNKGFSQEGEENDADDESDEPISPTANSGASLQGGVQDSRGNSHDSYGDEVYDPKDPRYDVHGAVRKFGKNNEPESNTSKAEQNTQTLSGGDGNNDSGSNHASLQRDYTNASLVPAPLSVMVRRNNTIHETSSPATTSATSASRPGPRPASAADVDISPLEPEIETQRPRSFVIREWPPENYPEATFDNAPGRQALWHTPPSQEIIERSRQAREQMEWEEEAKKVVLQKARDAGETLSEEEVARRVRRMYERSSRFMLDAATFKPATPPARPANTTASAQNSRSGRVRAKRAPRGVPLSGTNANSHTSHNNRPARSEPAFASSQALPFAASTTSVIAQDGSRSGSPPVRRRLRRRRLRRSNPEHDLSRPY